MKLKRFPPKAARIEMLPLIDIVFLLLVFFIYAMLSMSVHHGMPLKLPKSSQATQIEQAPVTLSIKNGTAGIEIYLEKQQVLLTELHLHLKQLDETRNDSPQLLVFAEDSISYQQLYQVLDQVKLAGISRISLQAVPE